MSLLALVALLGCPKSEPPPVDRGVIPAGFDKAALFTNLGEHVVMGTLTEFRDSAKALEAATSSLAAARRAGGGDPAASQASLRASMATWQRAEMMQFGPAGTPSAVRGGADLRAGIYSWPTVNSCRIDQEIVAGNYGNVGFFSGALANVYGLDALEYLLFYDDPDNSCPRQVDINQGSWAALGAAEVNRRRAAYAAAVAAQLVGDAEKLLEAWSPSGGNFLAALASAGDGSAVYTDAHHVLDDIFVAMFYLDLRTKDAKLAIPLGISMDCTATTCPDRVESPWARHSKENLRANLVGFQQLLLGGAVSADRLGLDDLLKAIGAADLATGLAGDVAAAIAAVDAIGPSLTDALASEPAAVRAAYDAIKAVTDRMKSQMVTVLNLKIPDEGAGDND